MKWISVKKELPEDDRTILVTNSKISQLLPMLAYYEEEDKTFTSCSSISSFPLEVTHWTEFPKYPQEDS